MKSGEPKLELGIYAFSAPSLFDRVIWSIHFWQHMLTEKWVSAYHEGGHCEMGRFVSQFSVDRARIFENQSGEWEGESKIELAERSDVERAAVALGGMLAEARIKTKCGVSILRIAVGEKLVAVVTRFINSIKENGLAVDEVPIPMEFIAGCIQTVHANFTRSDIDNIPPPVQRDETELARALKLAADHINLFTEWAMVRQAAENIYAGAPDWVNNVFDIR
jgi:hypothetical protein